MRNEPIAIDAGRDVLGSELKACSALLLSFFSLFNTGGGDNTIRSNIFHVYL